MQLSDLIEQRLESTGITLEEFRGLLIRLINYGVLERGESQTEQELYDRFVRVEELAGEMLSLYGIVVHHDRRFEYARLYPPGSRTRAWSRRRTRHSAAACVRGSPKMRWP